MSTLSIFRYDGADVRMVVIEGEPWFVTTDVAAILGYRDSYNLTRRLDEDEKGTHSLSTPGGIQVVGIINEAGLFAAILGSQVDGAKRFKRWVTHEILPEIRRTGSYGNVAALPDISTPEGVLALAQTLTKTAEDLVAAQHAVKELAPRAEAWDELASADGDYEVSDAAKILARAGVETGRQRLFGQLEGLGWIYRGSQGKWKARQTAVDSGYLAEKPQSHHHPRTGELVLDPPQVRVTVKGLERLRVRLGVLKAVSA